MPPPPTPARPEGSGAVWSLNCSWSRERFPAAARRRQGLVCSCSFTRSPSVASTVPVIHLIALYILWSFSTCTFWTETIIFLHWQQSDANKTTLISRHITSNSAGVASFNILFLSELELKPSMSVCTCSICTRVGPGNSG